MSPEDYDSTVRQILLLASLVNEIDVEAVYSYQVHNLGECDSIDCEIVARLRHLKRDLPTRERIHERIKQRRKAKKESTRS